MDRANHVGRNIQVFVRRSIFLFFDFGRIWAQRRIFGLGAQYINGYKRAVKPNEILHIKDIHRNLGFSSVDLRGTLRLEPLHLRAGIGILPDENYRRQGFGFQALQLMEEYTILSEWSFFFCFSKKISLILRGF
ncbi:MAG: hypothetical protein LBG15_02250 [Dysgonamonadaceae bacterium]|jgi:hypothetical protein|nr:hypothetical protein [Dysgonamonadaceae bacterium]